MRWKRLLLLIPALAAVSYTHLDVYKRQSGDNTSQPNQSSATSRPGKDITILTFSQTKHKSFLKRAGFSALFTRKSPARAGLFEDY